MRILLLQETDWIKRGPHQQHHLMDRMALKGHEIHVIDYEYLWKDDNERKIFTGRKEIKGAYKIFKDADITLIRPGLGRLVLGLSFLGVFYLGGNLMFGPTLFMIMLTLVGTFMAFTGIILHSMSRMIGEIKT